MEEFILEEWNIFSIRTVSAAGLENLKAPPYHYPHAFNK